MSKSASGNIRKKTVVRNGKQYTYWEARYTAGYDPSTGKQIQRSVSGKNQKEVRQKLTESQSQIDNGTYMEPSKITLGQWLDTWAGSYLIKIKAQTADSYKGHIQNHIKPALGNVPLGKLNNLQIQTFYAGLYEKGLSAKTVRNIHGTLHKALSQAVKIPLIARNPADNCELTKSQRPEIIPLDGPQISAFFKAIKGHRFENLYTVILLLGLRESEALGLTWDNVDWNTGNVTIDKQLLPKDYTLAPTKNNNSRIITASSVATDALKQEKMQQMENRFRLGSGWDPKGLVFTNPACDHLCHVTVYKDFKKIASEIGCPNARLHDLRHSYAVLSLQAGDDIKTVQEHLGHATAAFTLATYSHVTESMQQASADRQDAYLKSLKNA